MSFSVYTFGREISIETARALPRGSRGSCWNGSTLSVPLSWSVAIDPQALWFVCSLPGGRVCTRPGTHGEFVEGLWEEDVAELFIKGADGRYQEFNVGPSGAWWSVTFSTYRTRSASSLRPHLLSVTTDMRTDRWEVVAAFARSALDVELASTSSLHVSGMWYRPDPCFLSSSPASGVAPDYHHEACFEPVSFLEFSPSE